MDSNKAGIRQPQVPRLNAKAKFNELACGEREPKCSQPLVDAFRGNEGVARPPVDCFISRRLIDGHVEWRVTISVVACQIDKVYCFAAKQGCSDLEVA